MNLNYNIRKTAGSLTILATVLVLPHLVQATEYPYSIGQGFEFSSGKYGSNIADRVHLCAFNRHGQPDRSPWSVTGNPFRLPE